MPLLTITNLSVSPVSIQDLGGLISVTVQGSSTVTDRVITEEQFAAVEAQLIAQTTAGNLRWSVRDNPLTLGDSVPASALLLDEATYFAKSYDFHLAAAAALPLPLAKAVQGSATGDFLANTLGGVYSLATAAVSEAEAAQLTHADQLMLCPAKGLVFEARVRVNFPGATVTADERWVVGLVTAHATAQTALDGTTINAWFRGEGANLNILVEGDDNVTDTDDVVSTISYVKNTFMLLKIDFTDLTKVKFFVNGVLVPTTVNLGALTTANLVQPIFCYQRDAGAEINQLDVDWYRVVQAR
jgi:hypothetical protein